jgi:type I restriction enzyme, S subunit
VEVRKGFKQTEAGVIPEGWEVNTLRELTTLLTNGFVGTATTHYTKASDGVLYIQGFNVEENSFNLTGIKRVSREFHNRHSKSHLQEGDLLTIQTGDVGLTTIVPKEFEGSNCHALIISRFKKQKAYPKFFSQYFNSAYCRQRLKNIETGTTMKHLNVTDMLEFQVVVPPLAEQQAIAVVLSDIDALLNSLDTLIAKKRLVKQGAMQELLTGKKRLPGFSDEWKVKSLGAIGEIDSENLTSKTDPEYSFKYISLEDVDFGTLKNYTELTFRFAPSRARRVVRKNDILISTVRPNLKSHLFIRDNVSDTICSTGFSVLRCNPSVANPAYVFFHLFAYQIENKIETLLTGSNYPAINSKDVKALQIPIPMLVEQTAIAEILSDMDAEIAALEQKRDKTRLLKQGMMQELLTGRIRLV